MWEQGKRGVVTAHEARLEAKSFVEERRVRRERVEVALELQSLAAVLFAAARGAPVGRGALLSASEALAEAPLHCREGADRELLTLVRAAGVALRGGLHTLEAPGALQQRVAREVSIRLSRIEAELAP